LIVGGGYHGKSTLLDALQRGVYPHVPGDGREYVVTNPGAVKIRAEDGRSIQNVDISPFISNLPRGRSSDRFSSDDASGSTSQAANIVEAVEVGARVLLLDEDTSATNFMVRDARMQALVHKEHEPITPFLDRVRELSESQEVSTVVVMGGCGDYFDVADHVIMMRDYLPIDATTDAAVVAADHPTSRLAETPSPLVFVSRPAPHPDSFDPSRGRKQVKIDAPAVDEIRFGRNTIDLRGVEQLVDRSQTAAVGRAMHLAVDRLMKDPATLSEIVDALERIFDDEGLDALDKFVGSGVHPGDFARPRRFEIAAAINRLRTLRFRQKYRHIQRRCATIAPGSNQDEAANHDRTDRYYRSIQNSPAAGRERRPAPAQRRDAGDRRIGRRAVVARRAVEGCRRAGIRILYQHGEPQIARAAGEPEGLAVLLVAVAGTANTS
jgi:predicted ABC-class ATPase